MLRTMHLFAGAGGGLLSDLILGHKPRVAVEWDAYACQVLRERAADGWFPGLHVWEGDVRLFDPSEYAGSVDCICSGFPCQDISVAGKQAGVGTETRSGLYREVLRIASVVRPRYLFLENVAAIVTNGLGTVLADLTALGYDSEWLCLRASDCGANHRRDRWWLLATHADSGNGSPKQERQYERAEESCGSGAGAMGSLLANTERDSTQQRPEPDVQRGRKGEAKQAGMGGCDVAYPKGRQSRQQAEWQGREDIGRGGNEIGEVLADTPRELPHRGGGTRNGRPEPANGGEYVPNTSDQGLQGSKEAGNNGGNGKECRHEQLAGRGGVSRGNGAAQQPLGGMAYELSAGLHDSQEFQGWWTQEPDIGRVTTGCDNRASQLKALGNAQVPLQAAVAWRLLGGES